MGARGRGATTRTGGGAAESAASRELAISAAAAQARAGYTERTRDLNFTTGPVDANGAIQVLRAAQAGLGGSGYNEFRFETTRNLISRNAAANPDLRYRFGREGSPVLYVTGPAAQQRNFYNAMSRLRTGKPDETNIDSALPTGGQASRYWWD